MKNQNSSTVTGAETNRASNKFDSRRELLESSKLSRLPSLPRQQTAMTEKPAVVLCVRCETELTGDNQKIKGARVCVDCLSIYATIGTEIDRAADSKARENKIEKFGGLCQ